MKRWSAPRRPVLAAALVALAAGGCGLELRDRLQGVKQQLAEARDRGAYRCAPRELALGETHAEFAAEELHHGSHAAARDEVEVAADNARLAFDRSSRERCLARPAAPAAPPAPGDADGDGVLDPDDRCPTVPGAAANAGCPWPDRDGDGVLDRDDRCPDQPGPVAHKGCPPADRDKDGVLDGDDQCPDEPGPAATAGCPDRDRDAVLDRDDRCPDEPGPAANQGCPYKLIVVTKEKIELRQKVFFDTDKATIKKASFEMLGEIADVLAKSPTLELRIEGHTDSRAGVAHNMKLSHARAAAVRQFLIGRGADPTRMAAHGYGPTRPIDDNRTAVGREANRRVEFVITKQ